MSDNRAIRGPQDSSRVNLNEEYEIQYWCSKLSCSRDDLIKAVTAVGNSVVRVEDYLGSR